MCCVDISVRSLIKRAPQPLQTRFAVDVAVSSKPMRSMSTRPIQKASTLGIGSTRLQDSIDETKSGWMVACFLVSP